MLNRSVLEMRAGDALMPRRPGRVFGVDLSDKMIHIVGVFRDLFKETNISVLLDRSSMIL